MKILLSCIFFRNFTGSEMYVYELAKNLVKEGCDVSVVSQHTNGPLVDIAKKNGIKVFDMKNPPGFKLIGNSYHKISDVNFDIIHCQHVPMTQAMISLYPNIKKISTIHSEIINVESPVKHPSILRYIAIRPEIKNHMIKNFGISENLIDVIYNPIDSERFNKINTKKENYLLFVGSLENLRKKPIFDLIEYTKSKNMELWIVGTNHSNYLENVLSNSHVKHFPPTQDVERFFKNCSETGGILLGRTTIEGWMCGKPGWIYDVDKSGNVINKSYHEPPLDVNKFSSQFVTKQIKEIYYKIK